MLLANDIGNLKLFAEHFYYNASVLKIALRKAAHLEEMFAEADKLVPPTGLSTEGKILAQFFPVAELCDMGKQVLLVPDSNKLADRAHLASQTLCRNNPYMVYLARRCIK